MTVGVVGAGAMGRGIAQVAATAGHRVVLSDAREGAVHVALDAIRSALAREVSKGRMEQQRADDVLARIVLAGTTSHDLDAFHDCGIVIRMLDDSIDRIRHLTEAVAGIARSHALAVAAEARGQIDCTFL